MDHTAYAYKHSMKAFRTIESLVTLRQDQNATLHKEYINILAPFYYKVGDFLATFIELNTDEFGNIKPLPADCLDSDSEGEGEDEEDKDPNEESKDEVQPDAQEPPQLINTMMP